MTDVYRFERYKAADQLGEDGGRVPGAERGRYLASAGLAAAVNTSLAAEQPLLVAGAPGTGKSTLADSIAAQLGLGEVLRYQTRSDSTHRDALYRFDNLRRFYDAHHRREDAELPATEYRTFEALGEAIQHASKGGEPRVVLIDEVDKAPRDFPNGLLLELEKMEFSIPETKEYYKAPQARRPIVILTTNSERQLPEPFLRRCVFHYIDFPGPTRLQQILRERLNLDDALIVAAVERFAELLETYRERLDKPPATGELLKWVQVLHRAGKSADVIRNTPLPQLPSLGSLLKTQKDMNEVAARVLEP
jgi:MoxR-like ATPase